MMASPAGLVWEHISEYHWLLWRNGSIISGVYRIDEGYYAKVHLLHAGNTRYDTLAEAQAVAVALVAMR